MVSKRRACYNQRMELLPSELEVCVRVLKALVAEPALLATLDAEQRRELMRAAGQVSRPGRSERKRLIKAMRRRARDERRRHDARLLASTLNREARSSGFILPASTADPSRVTAPAAGAAELKEPRDCYVCKRAYRRLHMFYDSLCPECAELNYEKRVQTAPLDGRVALITGARIKIGYQAALMLLRAGAEVVATTRFVHDAALRFGREPDFGAWRQRLRLHGIDLRHAPSVERFAQHLCGTLPRLDILINNAAQTVRRPPAFYAHLTAVEERALPPALQPLLLAHHALEREVGLLAPARGPLAPTDALDAALFPDGARDGDQQQVDLRQVNSWRLRLSEVDTAELIEVHLVNAVAPFILAGRLRPLLARTRAPARYIVNVSAMEAQFGRNKKTDKHPHTNMAKAALNMMTRTSAVDYAADGIYMNSVDTGWVTDEDPLVHVARKQSEHDFHPPLDAIDGAARVCDPIFTAELTGAPVWGQFLKDYKPTRW
jgi:NAD(P)-dependent dehydrogenase (short-subunit alcohol dehydrogenase family)